MIAKTPVPSRVQRCFQPQGVLSALNDDMIFSKTDNKLWNHYRCLGESHLQTAIQHHKSLLQYPI